jgi:hypothetical protein
VDRLTDWVRRLPIPAWLFYGLLWILLTLVHVASEWADGSQPVGRVERWQLFFAAWAPLSLALIHYLDDSASTALHRARPALRLTAASFAEMRYRLTTLPRGLVRLWTIVMVAAFVFGVSYFIRAIGLPPSALFFSYTPPSFATDVFILGMTNSILTGLFVYHTLHQLRIVNEVYSHHAVVDLFQMRPLYALSGVTVRTAIGLLAVGYIFLLGVVPVYVDLAVAGPTRALAFPLLGQTVSLWALAVACFALPVTEIHRLMADEKVRLRSGLDRRMNAVLTEMHRRIDRGKWKEAESFQRIMNGLVVERDVLTKIPTWPWSPGAPGALLSALLLPVAIWVIQQILERAFPP